jgi:hypothetical protein
MALFPKFSFDLTWPFYLVTWLPPFLFPARWRCSRNSPLTSCDPSTWSRDFPLFSSPLDGAVPEILLWPHVTLLPGHVTPPFSPARGRCSRSYKRWQRPLHGQLSSAYVCEYIRPIEINLWNLRSPCHYNLSHIKSKTHNSIAMFFS